MTAKTTKPRAAKAKRAAKAAGGSKPSRAKDESRSRVAAPVEGLRRIFVTGGTGFVGSRLVPKLAEIFDEVYVLVRPESLDRAARVYGKIAKVRLVLGDLQNPGLLHLQGPETRGLKECTDVVHLGASYDLNASAGAAYLANVVGTQNLLDWCNGLERLERFHFASTIAIAGDFKGDFRERMFNVGQRFSNPYAQTKFRAEGLVGSWKNERVKRIVYRLGVVVGDSRTGAIPKIDGPYYLLRALVQFEAYLKGLARIGWLPLPFDRGAKIPMIPVDALAELLTTMITHPCAVPGRLRTYHVTGESVLVESFVRQALAAYGYDCRLMPMARKLVPASLPQKLGMPASLLDYMYGGCGYDTAHVKEDYPDAVFPTLESFSKPMFEYARSSWGKGGSK